MKKLLLLLCTLLILGGCITSIYKVPIDEPSPPGGHVSVLLETWFMESDKQISIGPPGGSWTSHDAVATDFRDNIDGTYDSSTAIGDGVNPGYVIKGVSWKVGAVDHLYDVGTIDFIRVRMKTQLAGDPGASATIQLIYHSNTIAEVSYLDPSGNLAWISHDYLTDPLFITPWVYADLTTAYWGFVTVLETFDQSSTTSVRVVEYRIEIWGSPPIPTPTVRLGGYTSYDVGRFNTGGPEATVLPEVAAAVARGDLRYMRQE